MLFTVIFVRARTIWHLPTTCSLINSFASQQCLLQCRQRQSVRHSAASTKTRTTICTRNIKLAPNDRFFFFLSLITWNKKLNCLRTTKQKCKKHACPAALSPPPHTRSIEKAWSGAHFVKGVPIKTCTQQSALQLRSLSASRSALPSYFPRRTTDARIDRTPPCPAGIAVCYRTDRQADVVVLNQKKRSKYFGFACTSSMTDSIRSSTRWHIVALTRFSPPKLR